ncbi:MAG: FxsA family protein [Gammaproteobacteria bacterium]
MLNSTVRIRYWLFAVLLLPLVEIFVLVKVGHAIGALNTVLAIVFAAILGVFTMRVQGFATAFRVRAAVARGELPGTALLDGLWLLLAGLLLLIPGFISDAIALLLFIPVVRQTLGRVLVGSLSMPVNRTGAPQGDTSGPRTLEGEYKRHDD